MQFKNIDHETYQTIDKGHGRIEIRRYWLMGAVEHLENAHQWKGLKRIGMVQSERCNSGQTTQCEQRYYLVSLDGGVEQLPKKTKRLKAGWDNDFLIRVLRT